MDIIAFYLRLSLADGDLGKNNKDESNSIENQRLLLQSFVESMDELDGEIKEYIDDGYSGTNFNRPAFQEMIEDAKKGKIDVLLVKDLSRLGRDYIGVGDYLEQIFPIMGVRVIAINSQYDSNNYVGKTMGLEMSITNLVNTLYSRDLSKKYKSCIQTKWKQGVSTGGRIPFGYKKAEDRQWEIDEEPAKIVRMVFELAMNRCKILRTHKCIFQITVNRFSVKLKGDTMLGMFHKISLESRSLLSEICRRKSNSKYNILSR